MGFLARKFSVLLIVLLVVMVALLWAAKAQESIQLPLQIILVNTQAEAEEISQRLKAGKSFEKLAKEQSTDPTASKGGYLAVC